eukprot:gene761-1234_t
MDDGVEDVDDDALPEKVPCTFKLELRGAAARSSVAHVSLVMVCGTQSELPNFELVRERCLQDFEIDEKLEEMVKEDTDSWIYASTVMQLWKVHEFYDPRLPGFGARMSLVCNDESWQDSIKGYPWTTRKWVGYVGEVLRAKVKHKDLSMQLSGAAGLWELAADRQNHAHLSLATLCDILSTITAIPKDYGAAGELRACGIRAIWCVSVTKSLRHGLLDLGALELCLEGLAGATSMLLCDQGGRERAVPSEGSVIMHIDRLRSSFFGFSLRQLWDVLGGACYSRHSKPTVALCFARTLCNLLSADITYRVKFIANGGLTHLILLLGTENEMLALAGMILSLLMKDSAGCEGIIRSGQLPELTSIAARDVFPPNVELSVILRRRADSGDEEGWGCSWDAGHVGRRVGLFLEWRTVSVDCDDEVGFGLPLERRQTLSLSQLRRAMDNLDTLQSRPALHLQGPEVPFPHLGAELFDLLSACIYSCCYCASLSVLLGLVSDIGQYIHLLVDTVDSALGCSHEDQTPRMLASPLIASKEEVRVRMVAALAALSWSHDLSATLLQAGVRSVVEGLVAPWRPQAVRLKALGLLLGLASHPEGKVDGRGGFREELIQGGCIPLLLRQAGYTTEGDQTKDGPTASMVAVSLMKSSDPALQEEKSGRDQQKYSSAVLNNIHRHPKNGTRFYRAEIREKMKRNAAMMHAAQSAPCLPVIHSAPAGLQQGPSSQHSSPVSSSLPNIPSASDMPKARRARSQSRSPPPATTLNPKQKPKAAKAPRGKPTPAATAKPKGGDPEEIPGTTKPDGGDPEETLPPTKPEGGDPAKKVDQMLEDSSSALPDVWKGSGQDSAVKSAWEDGDKVHRLVNGNRLVEDEAVEALVRLLEASHESDPTFGSLILHTMLNLSTFPEAQLQLAKFALKLLLAINQEAGVQSCGHMAYSNMVQQQKGHLQSKNYSGAALCSLALHPENGATLWDLGAVALHPFSLVALLRTLLDQLNSTARIGKEKKLLTMRVLEWVTATCALVIYRVTADMWREREVEEEEEKPVTPPEPARAEEGQDGSEARRDEVGDSAETAEEGENDEEQPAKVEKPQEPAVIISPAAILVDALLEVARLRWRHCQALHTSHMLAMSILQWMTAAMPELIQRLLELRKELMKPQQTIWKAVVGQDEQGIQVEDDEGAEELMDPERMWQPQLRAADVTRVPPDPEEAALAFLEPKEAVRIELQLKNSRRRNKVHFNDHGVGVIPDNKVLAMWEAHEGSKVCEDLFPKYDLPDGRQVHFHQPKKQLVDEQHMGPVAAAAPLFSTEAMSQGGLPSVDELMRQTCAMPPATLPDPVKQRPLAPPKPPKAILFNRPTMVPIFVTGQEVEGGKKLRVQRKPASQRPPTPKPPIDWFKHIFKKHKSVFAPRRRKADSKDYYDTQACWSDSFEIEWAMLATKPGLVKLMGSPDDVSHAKQVTFQFFMILHNIFYEYCSLDLESPWNLGLNCFTKFAKDAKIIDETSANCKAADLDQYFIAVNVVPLKNSKANLNNPARSLVMYEWLDMLVRCGIAKYGSKDSQPDTAPLSPSKAYERLLHEIFKVEGAPLECSHAVAVAPDDFRIAELYKEEGLSRSTRLTVPDYMSLMQSLHLIVDGDNGMLVAREVLLCFMKSRMLIVNPREQDFKGKSLDFVDFLECLARLADCLSPPTLDDLRGSGVESVLEYYKMTIFSRTKPLPRRSSYGMWSPNTRPLVEKIQKLMDLIEFHLMKKHGVSDHRKLEKESACSYVGEARAILADVGIESNFAPVPSEMLAGIVRGQIEHAHQPEV